MDKKENNSSTRSTGVYLSNLVATTIAFFILVLAVAAGFFAKSYFNGAPSKSSDTIAAADTAGAQIAKQAVTLSQVRDAFNNAVIKFGDTKSKVIFVEVSDPSCPYCSIASGQNGELNKQAGERFLLVKDGGTYEAPVDAMRQLVDEKKASYALLYFNGHGAGEMAMKSLYCAFDAGKFWQVHDLLMSNSGYEFINTTVKNDKGKTDELLAFLSSAIDQNTLRSCLDSGKYDSRMAEDMNMGSALGVSGTPAFFVNEKLYAGAYSFADMRPVVEALLK